MLHPILTRANTPDQLMQVMLQAKSFAAKNR
jgi:hypothetical protein